MKSERIGNDIKIEWSLLREGTPFSLSNKDVSIYLGSQFGRTKISGFTIDSNKVIWTFFGKDQKSLGKYSLVLVINEGNEGMITTDICDFVNLVSCSCEVGGTDNEDVQTETIALISNLEYIASEYYDDTAIWEYIEKMEKAKADKAEIPTRVSQLENDAEYATVGDLGGKQDKISDLDAIRRGAQKGATALQEIPAEYVNDKELENALRPKVNRYEVATINGQSILNGGNIVIEGYDDTGIKKDISDLKANDALQDAELAKLSAEVGELSDKVDELGQPIFKAVYGETTYNEIKSAYESGMVVHCDYIGNCYVLSRIDSNNAYLTCTLGTIVYRIMCSSASTWANTTFTAEQTTNKVTSISESSTDTQYPSAKAVFMATSKKSEVSLEALANGNLKVTIDGESKDFMPATPSGDPMHYMFETAGATYNAESGFWSYGQIFSIDGKWHGLTDLTNADMRSALLLNPSFSFITPMSGQWGKSVQKARIAFSYINKSSAISLAGAFNQNDSIEFIALSDSIATPSSLVYTFFGCEKLKTIVTRLLLNNITTASNVNSAFSKCKLLENVCIYQTKVSLEFKESPSLSNASILYMIQNEAATAAITITLHADAYARAMADAEIVAALEAHPNVSLASA